MEELLWWHWIVFGLVVLIVDIVVISSFYILWFGLGAIIAGTTLLIADVSTTTQVVIWGVSSALMLAAWVAFHRSRQSRAEAGMIGVTGVVVEWSQGKGRIRFQRPYAGSDLWDAVCSGEFSISDNAKVAAVDVAKATVTLQPETTPSEKQP